MLGSSAILFSDNFNIFQKIIADDLSTPSGHFKFDFWFFFLKQNYIVNFDQTYVLSGYSWDSNTEPWNTEHFGYML